MYEFRFETSSGCINNDLLVVEKFSGTEEISELYRYEIILTVKNHEIEHEDFMGSNCTLIIGEKDLITDSNVVERKIHGVVSRFCQLKPIKLDDDKGVLYRYKIILSPKLWVSTQSSQYRIFQNKNIIEIINEVLEAPNGLVVSDNPQAKAQLGESSDDVVFLLEEELDVIEYKVQYNESDFAFISRLLEHHGIYYYFEQLEDKERIVFCDQMDDFPITGDSVAVYNPDYNVKSAQQNIIYELNKIHNHVLSNVISTDFSFTQSHVNQQAQITGSSNGIGVLQTYGEHCKSPQELEKITEIRTQESACRMNSIEGKGLNPRFSAGHIFTLKSASVLMISTIKQDFNYLLTKVNHFGEQVIDPSGNVGATEYYNEFESTEADIQFRPIRNTAVPKMYGIMNGFIDSEQDGTRADLDEMGRYLVRMPFDISDTAEGQKSKRIRMAQPYGGANAGFSFPILKGTEIIWACIDGDVDRPIIIGVVPNPEHRSPTNINNNRSAIIKTHSGITMSFNDGEGVAQQSNGSSNGQQGNQRIEPVENIRTHSNVKTSENALHEKEIDTEPSIKIKDTQKYSVINNSVNIKLDETEKVLVEDFNVINQTSVQSLEMQQQQEVLLTQQDNYVMNEQLGKGNNFKLHVPYLHMDHKTGVVDEAKKGFSYLRMGNHGEGEKIEYGAGNTQTSPENVEINTKNSSWVDYTSGNRTTVTDGEKTEIINGGKSTFVVYSPTPEESKKKIAYKKVISYDESTDKTKVVTVDNTKQSKFLRDYKEEFILGGKIEGIIGSVTSYFGGVKTDISTGTQVSVCADVKVNVGASLDLTWTKGAITSISKEVSKGADDKVDLYVANHDTLNTDFEDFSKNGVAGVSTVAALGGFALGMVGASDGGGDIEDIAAQKLSSGGGWLLSAGLLALAAKVANKNSKVSKGFTPEKRNSQLKMDKVLSSLAVGDGSKVNNQVYLDNEKVTIGTGLKKNKFDSQSEIEVVDNKCEGSFLNMDEKKTYIRSGKGGEIELSTFDKEQFIKFYKKGNVQLRAKDGEDLKISNSNQTITIKKKSINIKADDIKSTGKCKLGKSSSLTVE
ncbi:type VI secretion system Vgr family protein [Marinicellulosiphila megalodicopiae]|uniref:type VI secretion system Vgr family protein n=1 Tax=Marinicellulosiphila megalodicopiae TaxID=2724896 RepID=UPI003BB18E4F